MKPRLTRKHMLIATLCCILLTLVDLLGSSHISPRDFKTVVYWIIVLIGWAVYFLERFKKK